MTRSEIVAAVQEAGHNISEGNVRTSISRVKDKKLIIFASQQVVPVVSGQRNSYDKMVRASA